MGAWVAMLAVTLAVAACDATPVDRDSGPPPSASPTRPNAPDPAPPLELVRPARVTTIDLDAVPVTTFTVDLAAINDGPPTRVPWGEYQGPSEYGVVEFLHVGARRFPLHDDPYLREVALWPSGPVWYSDYGLRFMRRDGTLIRIRNFPAGYGRIAFAPTKAYAVRDGMLVSISADDLTPRPETNLRDLAGLERNDPTVRASVAGLLQGDDPVLRISAGERRTRKASLYSVRRGILPLRPEWDYLHSPMGVTVGTDPERRVLAAFSSDSFRPLWTYRFRAGDKRRRIEEVAFTPSGRRLILEWLHQHGNDALVLRPRTGRPERVLRLPHYQVQFEDDSHFIYAAYDGVPNPAFDPNDPEPSVSDLDWPNVLVRCSLRAVCERVARVDPPERSLRFGPTHLFDR